MTLPANYTPFKLLCQNKLDKQIRRQNNLVLYFKPYFKQFTFNKKTMTKKFFGAFLLLALVLTISGFGGCGTKKQADESETISGSIEDLVKLGKSIKCDVGKTRTEYAKHKDRAPAFG